MIKIQGTHYMSDFEAKKAMTEVSRQMSDRGYLIASDGSLSVRIGPNAVWITAADAGKANLTQDMMVKVDLDGKPILGARVKELPKEMMIHLRIYRENPQVQAVIHGYPPVATGMGIRGIGVEAVEFTKTLRTLGAVPVVPYTGTVGDLQRISSYAGSGHGVLLQSNGCMTWGAAPTEAYHMLEAVEYYGTLMAGMTANSQVGKAADVSESAPPNMPIRVPVCVPELKGVTELVRLRQQPRSVTAVHSNETPNVICNTSTQTYDKVTEKSKMDVMAEVVRRAMQNYH